MACRQRSERAGVPRVGKARSLPVWRIKTTTTTTYAFILKSSYCHHPPQHFLCMWNILIKGFWLWFSTHVYVLEMNMNCYVTVLFYFLNTMNFDRLKPILTVFVDKCNKRIRDKSEKSRFSSLSSWLLTTHRAEYDSSCINMEFNSKGADPGLKFISLENHVERKKPTF